MLKFESYGGLVAYRVTRKEVKALGKTPMCAKCGASIEDDGYLVPIKNRVLCPRHFRIFNHGALRWFFDEEDQAREKTLVKQYDHALSKCGTKEEKEEEPDEKDQD